MKNEYGCGSDPVAYDVNCDGSMRSARTRALYFPLENKMNDVMLQLEHMGDDPHLLNALHNLRDALVEIGIYYDNKIKSIYNGDNK